MGDNFRAVQPLYGRKVKLETQTYRVVFFTGPAQKSSKYGRKVQLETQTYHLYAD